MSIPAQVNPTPVPASSRDEISDHQVLPDSNQLSVLVGTVMLVYALMPFIQTPGREYSFQLPGVYFVYTLSISTIAPFLVAALAASGMNWLLQGHPFSIETKNKFRLLQHSLLPALTAWSIGVPLQTIDVGPQWWAVFTFGGVLLVMVFISEYLVVDISDARHTPASIALTSVAFALFLILSVALRAAGLRLYLILPTLVFTIFLLTLRTIYLRTGHWSLIWSMVIALIIGQVVTAFHYWPLTPIKYGLLVLGLAYALTSIAGAVEEGQEWRKVWVEPSLMLAALWSLAFLLKV